MLHLVKSGSAFKDECFLLKSNVSDSTGVILQPVVWFGLVWLNGVSKACNLLWLYNLGLLAVVGV